MTPHYSDEWLTIYGGDCREVLTSLPADSVDCVVTSPPYWGLRNYGTATWSGGDEACDHVDPDWQARVVNSPKQQTQVGSYQRQEINVCRACGATRIDSQLGLERTPEEYVANMVAVFAEVRRVLKPSGTCWLNLGDSYAGSGRMFHGNRRDTVPGLEQKQLVGIPWRVAFALQADGWYLRSDIIWSKPNTMPESVTDRPTKSHEYLFMLTKSARYYFDADAVREPHVRTWDEQNGGNLKVGGTRQVGQDEHHAHGGGYPLPNPAGRNIRSVWNIATRPYPGAHFAVFPPELPERCIKAGSSERGVCPECGAPWERVVERVVTQPGVTGGASWKGVEEHAQISKGLTRPGGFGGGSATTTGWKPPYVPPSELDRYGTGEAGVHRKVGGQYQKWLDDHPKQTVGWNGCTHVVDPVPAVILDPFAGSGTVGMVANRLSRRAILIDLNPEYLKQQMTRNSQVPLGLTEGDAA